MNEKAQGQFVLVHLTVSNIGDKPQVLSDSAMKLKDAQGREFSSNTMAGIVIEVNKTFFEEINPGNKVTGSLVFDMLKTPSRLLSSCMTRCSPTASPSTSADAINSPGRR